MPSILDRLVDDKIRHAAKEAMAHIEHQAAIARANRAATRKYWERACSLGETAHKPPPEIQYRKAIKAGVVQVKRRKGKPPLIIWLI